ncbi:tRNA pseudouridine synthase A [Demequina sp. TTPB684]|uniref:tRNA pseudouridine synthase A n=1 Tax=unclassified Demequina TaxID=2620311 RepID=UPI001CF44653|nr:MULTISPECIES: tRNA pseudouridine synthase A [unclassified Demequina]MCB2412944.1 tRNA pseudouridine synthase A [Demequina sp. TTPB684]UPU88429.1 tRNA pseudouridine synthase A [Demequina sp. TMPB413]
MTELHGSDVVRARLDLSYHGGSFNGWGIQPRLRTVQGELEAGLRKVVRGPAGRTYDEKTLRITVAGRTDGGVHARGQAAHVDIPVEAWSRLPGKTTRTPAQALRERLDGVVGADIVVKAASIAPEGFDARFSALERHYEYRVCDRFELRDPLQHAYVTWIDRALDVEALNTASATLLGLRDFAPFCRGREGATTIRELREFSWRRVETGADAGLLVATVRADAFCHAMVRSLVGAVMAVGYGRRDLQWLHMVATHPTRSPAITVAPPGGLTLERVIYPPDAEMASRAEATRARRAQWELEDARASREAT